MNNHYDQSINDQHQWPRCLCEGSFKDTVQLERDTASMWRSRFSSLSRWGWWWTIWKGLVGDLHASPGHQITNVSNKKMNPVWNLLTFLLRRFQKRNDFRFARSVVFAQLHALHWVSKYFPKLYLHIFLSFGFFLPFLQIERNNTQVSQPVELMGSPTSPPAIFRSLALMRIFEDHYWWISL